MVVTELGMVRVPLRFEKYAKLSGISLLPEASVVDAKPVYENAALAIEVTPVPMVRLVMPVLPNAYSAMVVTEFGMVRSPVKLQL